jgi:hypothetical protein
MGVGVMPKIAYLNKVLGKASVAVVAQANTIITEYQGQGFNLTLRQLYYQFVARGFIANRQTEYKRLGSIINDARLAGMIDWNSIEDRTRWLRSTDADHGDPDKWLSSIYTAFSKSRWDNQPYAVEVWIEKDALVGVVQAACDPLFAPYFACRGYASQSEVWAAAQRMIRYDREGKDTVILHLGDHDPSGIDMTRDIEDRLAMFCRRHGANPPEIRRLALNMDQVDEWQPPPNPAKTTDSRAADYIEKFGDESWELDALDPTTLRDLITDNIEPLIDRDAWDEQERVEEEGQERLKLVADNWGRVVTFLEENSANGS